MAPPSAHKSSRPVCSDWRSQQQDRCCYVALARRACTCHCPLDSAFALCHDSWCQLPTQHLQHLLLPQAGELALVLRLLLVCWLVQDRRAEQVCRLDLAWRQCRSCLAFVRWLAQHVSAAVIAGVSPPAVTFAIVRNTASSHLFGCHHHVRWAAQRPARSRSRVGLPRHFSHIAWPAWTDT